MMDTKDDNAPSQSESTISSELLYDGRVVRLFKDQVRLPNGRSAMREVVRHRPAVVIIAEDAEHRLLLIRQHRYPIHREIYELPAGIVEDGEDLADAAERELQEEAGWKSASLTPIAEVWSSPGFTDELFALFYARDLQSSELPADEDEFITHTFYTREEVESMLSRGEIKDAKTLLGIYWWQMHS